MTTPTQERAVVRGWALKDPEEGFWMETLRRTQWEAQDEAVEIMKALRSNRPNLIKHLLQGKFAIVQVEIREIEPEKE